MRGVILMFYLLCRVFHGGGGGVPGKSTSATGKREMNLIPSITVTKNQGHVCVRGGGGAVS